MQRIPSAPPSRARVAPPAAPIGGRRSACLLALAALSAASPAGAQVFAQAAPVRYSLTVPPGETLAREVAISNLGSSPVEVHVRLSDWEMSEAGDVGFRPLGSTPASLDGCVRFAPREFSLGPGESRRVRLALAFPAQGPASRWGVLLSEVRPASPAATLGHHTVAELGTTLLLSRMPASEIRAEATDMVVTPLGDDSLSISVRITNAGQRHAWVGGEVAIADSLGVRVAGGALPGGAMLPGRSRDLTWRGPVSLVPGNYTAAATVDLGLPDLAVLEIGFAWAGSPPTPALARGAGE